jgi:predicted Zn-dependent protease
MESAPADPEPRGSLARLYLAENKFSQAEEFLKGAQKDFPDNSVGYRMLGDFYFANNRLDQATTEYAALYREHPKDITVKKYYVQLLILKDQLDEAS